MHYLYKILCRQQTQSYESYSLTAIPCRFLVIPLFLLFVETWVGLLPHTTCLYMYHTDAARFTRETKNISECTLKNVLPDSNRFKISRVAKRRYKHGIFREQHRRHKVLLLRTFIMIWCSEHTVSQIVNHFSQGETAANAIIHFIWTFKF